MISAYYCVSCDACNRHQLPAECEDEKDAIDEAAGLGWIRVVVPNGATWDICPRCRPEYEKYPQVTAS